eukprot:TRINITY_DN69344_c0_g1_i1.p1 TRINITY_DN69344_c0_g1~~TRINITY_DN69344_c0_g1_i1.p1  ORF type:complete len:721 (+),score=46.30 TRINITY_DN69344_c0_g1_i1:105-2267(+)
MFSILILSNLALPIFAQAISDMKHVVVFMQENRAFDHYYGSMRGVRGFSDRAATLLPSGRPVFWQPVSANTSEYQLPFHAEFTSSDAQCLDAPEMDFPCDMKMWNEGKMDAWNTARDPGYGMMHFQREDLPFYYALADAFTIGDQYFQSTFTATNPNRLFLFSGSNGLSVGQQPVLDNHEPHPGWEWPTAAEVLEDAGVSWHVLQERDNFDDNGFAWFKTFQEAKPGSSWFDKGMARVADVVSSFDAMLANDSLPQVLYIVGPAMLSEHATNHPAAGEDLSARLIARLRAHPSVYAKTAFILNYDEGGQFFDHATPPTAPTRPAPMSGRTLDGSQYDGKSTVDVSGDVWKNYMDTQHVPIGPGFRVPLMVISPWTRGGFVTNAVYDHTSVLRLIETRFNVSFDNISPWRRAVCGDLVTAFDFSRHDTTWPSDLPDTREYFNTSFRQCLLPPPPIPTKQRLPIQEPGVRPARVLPFNLSSSADPVCKQTKDDEGNCVLQMSIAVQGSQGAALQMYDLLNVSGVVRHYTVGPDSNIVDSVTIGRGGAYRFVLHGSNGFVRVFAGSVLPSERLSPRVSLDLTTHSESDWGTIGVLLNATPGASALVTDNAYGNGPWRLSMSSSGQASVRVPVAHVGHWYDLTVSIEGVAWERRLMGRVEASGVTSDPAVDSPLHPRPSERPVDLPLRLREVRRHPPQQKDAIGYCDRYIDRKCVVDADPWEHE